MIARRPNVNARDDNSLTALHTAAHAGNDPGIELLLANGALLARTILGRTVLHMAVMRGHETTAMTLMKNYGADCMSNDHRGMSAMHHAALRGHVALFKVLLEYGADVF